MSVRAPIIGVWGFFEDTIKALNDAGIENVVDGDLAVVLHGYVRITLTLELTVHVREGDAGEAQGILRQLARSSGGAPETTLVAHDDSGFDELMAQSAVIQLDSTKSRVPPMEGLIAKKRNAGPPLHLVEAEALETIQRELEGASPPPRDGWELNRQDQMRGNLRAKPTRRLEAFEELNEFARNYTGIAGRPSSQYP